MKNSIRIGLGLSGGGYRATAYHIGTLKKLNELGILDNVDVMSCVSGGSITGAFYGLTKDDFETFEREAKLAVKKNVIVAVLTSPWFYFALLIIIFTSYITLKLHTVFFLFFQSKGFQSSSHTPGWPIYGSCFLHNILRVHKLLYHLQGQFQPILFQIVDLIHFLTHNQYCPVINRTNSVDYLFGCQN